MLTAVRRLLGFDPEVPPPSIKLFEAAGFFSALDKFQRDTFRRLRRRYPEPGSDSFCKLVALKAANAFAADHERLPFALPELPPQRQHRLGVEVRLAVSDA